VVGIGQVDGHLRDRFGRESSLGKNSVDIGDRLDGLGADAVCH
jgi:hypothetical protein